MAAERSAGGLAVLIITADRHEHLRRNLAALRRQTRPADEIVVVDLRPAPSSPRPARDGVRYVEHVPPADGPLPLASGRNLAAASTGCDQLVFLDVDCLAAPDLVERYGAILSQHPQAIACGPVRYLREGWLTATGTLEAASETHPARPRPPKDGAVLAEDHERFWSLAFGVTRRTWECIGGFDTGFVGYGAEDTDFGLRARQRRVPLAWFAGGVAYHQWHEPSRTDPARLDEMIANARRFRDRWGHWPMGGWFEELRALGRVRFDPALDLLERVDDGQC